jgi:hypothetical protein
MNPREKKLLIIVGVLVVLGGGYKIKQAYTAKLQTLDKQITRQESRLEEVQAEKRKANEAVVTWMKFGRETLSTDVNQARIELRDELNEISKRAGLRNIDASVSEHSSLAGGKLLKGEVTAQGSLDQVLRFLFDVHRQPYMVRCTDLDLDPVQPERGRRNRPGPRRGPVLLEMDVDLETPVLPDTKRVKKKRLKTADLEQQRNQREYHDERLMLASAADYGQSITEELFKPYSPPPPPPPKPDPKPKPTDPKPQPRPEPPPPPPADRMMTLGRMLSWPGGRQAVLEQSGRPDKRVEIGEEMYGGTLIYIHPKGAVTLQEDGKRLFHPLGEKLMNNQPLTKETCPEIYHRLAKLQRRAGGISKGPG